nr:PREDICTED: putative serine protease K12H4.7 [Bemisia tabaci]
MFYSCQVHRYAEFSKLIRGGQCLAHEFANLVAFLKDTNLGVLFGVRQWFYQTCTEFGWFFTSNRKNDLFGDKITADFGDSICTDAFNSKFDTSFVERSVNETNLNYGGYNLPVTRVAFVHGMNDPWSPLGIMKKAPKGSVAITIKGVAHCADMMPDQDTDSQPLKNARARISRMLERWIKAKTSEDEELSLADF